MNNDDESKPAFNKLTGWFAQHFGAQAPAMPEHSEYKPLKEIYLSRLRTFEDLTHEVVKPLLQSHENHVRFHPNDGRKNEGHKELLDRVRSALDATREHLLETNWFGAGLVSDRDWDWARSVALDRPDVLRIGVRQSEGKSEHTEWDIVDLEEVTYEELHPKNDRWDTRPFVPTSHEGSDIDR